MHEAEKLSLEQIRGFIAASEELRFASEDRVQRYAWVERVLLERQYASQGKAGRGLLHRYIEKMTGMSRAQVSRLIAGYAATGRVRIAEKWADALGGVPLAFIHKTRDPRVPNQVVSNRVVGEVQGRTCVLIDDMIDTGGTIAGAVKLLRDDGAKDVVIAATHGVLSDPASERLAQSGAKEVIVTNTLPIGEEKRFPQLTVLSIAPLLATTIRAVFENGSVTGLFDGDA